MNNKTVTLFLTPRYEVAGSIKRIGEVGAGLDLSGFNLKGATVAKARSIYTEGIDAFTTGVVLGKKSNNMFHENSSVYADAESSRQEIFAEITNKILSMVKNTKENIQVGLFGGWGHGNGKNTKDIETSHNLFNNVALCIEDELPKKEGIQIPLLTVWGKRDAKSQDAVYARENIIVLINDIFKNLFKNGKCDMTQQELKDFLNQHYEEVLIPDNVVIIPEIKHESRSIQENIKRKAKRVNLSV